MSNLVQYFEGFNGRKYNSVMDFMYDLQNAGFTSDFANSLVMRALWEKVDALIAATKTSVGNYYLSMTARIGQQNNRELLILVRTEATPDVQESVILFLRDNRIAVYHDVITEQVKVLDSDIPAAGALLSWAEADKAFGAQGRFTKQAHDAFKAVFKALVSHSDIAKYQLQIQPLPVGWQVEYLAKEEKVLTTTYHFA